MRLLAWSLAHPKLTLALVATLALAGWHWQDKISDWFDARKIARLEREVGELKASQAALAETLRQTQASAEAAQQAAEALSARTGHVRTQMRQDHEANRASAAASDLPSIVRRSRDAEIRARAAERELSGAGAD